MPGHIWTSLFPCPYEGKYSISSLGALPKMCHPEGSSTPLLDPLTYNFRFIPALGKAHYATLRRYERAANFSGHGTAVYHPSQIQIAIPQMATHNPKNKVSLRLKQTRHFYETPEMRSTGRTPCAASVCSPGAII